jgi:hypothetical protein
MCIGGAGVEEEFSVLGVWEGQMAKTIEVVSVYCLVIVSTMDSWRLCQNSLSSNYPSIIA